MAIVFRDFKFQNLNGIEVTMTLEAPIGSQVVSTTVAANGSYSSNPNLNDVTTAKITIVAKGHEQYPDVETITLTGSPYKTCLVTLQARSSIGSIKGDVAVQF